MYLCMCARVNICALKNDDIQKEQLACVTAFQSLQEWNTERERERRRPYIYKKGERKDKGTKRGDGVCK